MAMKAILSDIHANLEALDAVLDDMAEFDIEAIYCLGDTVGYGPDPGECLDISMHFQVALLGNHEEAARSGPVGFTAEATVAAEWTRRQIQIVRAEGDDPKLRRRFLERLKATHEEGDFLFVHGSPRNPTEEYIYPESVNDPGKLWDIFRKVRRYCFMGHTHIPGIFIEGFKFYTPDQLNDVWALDGRKMLCNVGSVGQPRDGDRRACYVLLDKKRVHFRRVPYDVKTTIKKIQQVPELRHTLHHYNYQQ